MVNKKKSLTFITYLFFVMSYLEDTIPYGQVLTFITLALMLVISQSRMKINIPKSRFITYLVLMLMYCCLSMLWAQSPSRTFIVVRGMLMTLIIITIAFICNYQSTTIDDFLKIVMYGGYTVIVYAIIRYGWSTLISVLSSDIRLSNAALMNANTLGMCAAYSVVINFYYVIYNKIKITDILCIPSILIIAASGSRKSILIVVVGVLLLTILKNYKKEKFFSNFFKGVIAVSGVVLLIYGLSKLSIFSTVITRFMMLSTQQKNYQGIVASDIRAVYNIVGWNVFKDHPILGIGIHNASLYISQYYGHPHLHNNFIELLACGGIVGFIVHYSFYFYLFSRFWKLRIFRNKEYDICLVLLTIRFVMGYFHIQYFQATNYFYLMVFYLYIKNLEKGKGFVGELRE